MPSSLTLRAFQRWDQEKGGLAYWVELAQDAAFRPSRLAVLYGLSRRQLEREWKQSFGEAPGPWLHRVRMLLAAYALWNGQSASEVAHDLKFCDAREMSRAFRQFFKISAAQFILDARKRPWVDVAKHHIGCREIPRQECALDPGSTRQPGPAKDARLSPREAQVLTVAAQGQTDKQTADTLRTSEDTVEYHWRRILQKLNSHSRAEAISICLLVLNVQ